MVTVIILLDGREENLKKTRDSLCVGNQEFQEKIKVCEAEADDWEEVSRLLSAAGTRYGTILRAGDSYVGDALERGCRCLDEIGEDVDAVVPGIPRGGKQQAKRSKGDRPKVFSLKESREILQAPAVFEGMIFRLRAAEGEAPDPMYGTCALEEFAVRILMKKQKLAYLEHAAFRTVSPLTEAGSFQPVWRTAGWYLDTVRQYCGQMLDSYGEGEVPLFLQAQVLYVLKLQFQMNLNTTDKGAFSQETFPTYYDLCKRMLARIESGLFLQTGREHPDRKLVSQVKTLFTQMRYEPSRDRALAASLPVTVQLMEVKEGALVLECTAELFQLSGGRKLQVCLGERELAYCDSARYTAVKFFGVKFEKKAFQLKLPLDTLKKKNRLTFWLRDGQQKQQLSVVSQGYQSRIASSVEHSYWCFGRYMVSFEGKGMEHDSILIRQAGRTIRMLQELRVLAKMPVGMNRSRSMFVQRIRYWLAYPFYHGKNIWLTFDKLYKGGDCGEYFYKYMVKRGEPGILPAFVIKKNTTDCRRLEQEGYAPLLYGTQKQRLSYLYARVVFGTHSNVPGFNGFDSWEIQFLQDRLRAVNTCIQHGLSVQDLTFDSNRIVNNNKRYYCASKYEVENLSGPEYDYGKEVLCLTGIPRYDGLVNRDRHQILITPTWRSYLAMPSVMGKTRPYNPEFKHTDYFRIFQELLLDQKLRETAARTGYRLIYLLHPVISAQKEDFQAEDGVRIVSASEINYEQILTESSLMVTDYSGVQFDFAYMRKPVVYFHPPKLPPHYVEGGFFYDTQGFGEICTEISSLVDTLCTYMEHGCELKGFYRKRQDDFFAFSDRENCRRIFEDALELQTRTQKFGPDASPQT